MEQPELVMKCSTGLGAPLTLAILREPSHEFTCRIERLHAEQLRQQPQQSGNLRDEDLRGQEAIERLCKLLHQLLVLVQLLEVLCAQI